MICLYIDRYRICMDTYAIDPADDALARAVDARREQERITRPELARRSGIPRATLSRYLRGERSMPFSKFMVIAAAMGVDVSELIDAARRILETAEKQPRI